MGGDLSHRRQLGLLLYVHFDMGAALCHRLECALLASSFGVGFSLADIAGKSGSRCLRPHVVNGRRLYR